MRRYYPAFRIILLVATVVAFIAATVWSGSIDVPDGLTGAPGENSCLSCHSGSPVSGSMTISGLPRIYDAGQTYVITVSVEEPGFQRWGFELTALNESNEAYGTFTITDAVNTELSDNTGTNADYVKHTEVGTYAGVPDGPVSWQFEWTAPDPAEGTVTMYASGVAADNDGSLSGDVGFTTTATGSLTSIPSGSPVGMIVLIMLLVGSTIFVIYRRTKATS